MRRLELGDDVLHREYGFGRVVRQGRFFVEVMFANNIRLQVANTTFPARAGVVDAQAATRLRKLGPEPVASLRVRALLDLAEHGLGRVESVTGDVFTVRLVKGRTIIQIPKPLKVGEVVEVWSSLIDAQADIMQAEVRQKRIERIIPGGKPLTARPPQPSTAVNPSVRQLVSATTRLIPGRTSRPHESKHASQPSGSSLLITACKICGKSFSRDQLQRHLIEAHTGRRRKKASKVSFLPPHSPGRRKKQAKTKVPRPVIYQGGLCNGR